MTSHAKTGGPDSHGLHDPEMVPPTPNALEYVRSIKERFSRPVLPNEQTFTLRVTVRTPGDPRAVLDYAIRSWPRQHFTVEVQDAD